MTKRALPFVLLPVLVSASRCGMLDPPAGAAYECLAALAADPGPLVLHAIGEGGEPAHRVAVPRDHCPWVVVEGDAPWLHAAVTPGGLSVSLRRDRLPEASGRYQATLSLRSRVGGGAFATVPVVLRRLARAPAGAPRRVLVVGVDGLRPDALTRATTPVFDACSRHAAWSLSAQTQQRGGETSSSPGWVSVLTGVDGDKHGIATNRTPGRPNARYPTFLLRARQRLGVRTAAAVMWGPLLDRFIEPEALDDRVLGGQGEVTDRMAGWLRSGAHQLHFVHLDGPDLAGHAEGFSPDVPAYVAAVEQADRTVGRLLDALLERPGVGGEEWLVVMTSDHGGEGTGHGAWSAACETIPLIVSGPGVRPERLAPGLFDHMAVHPTVLAFLGLFPRRAWGLDGQVIGVRSGPRS